MKMDLRSINWLALVAGILVLVLIPLSFISPWWQLTIGENLLTVKSSPVNSYFGFMATNLVVPLLWALNLTVILFLLASGVAMLIYSFVAAKPYSKDLLDFAYRKPLYMVIFFVAGLIGTILVLQAALKLDIPLMGTSNITLPSSLTNGADVSVVVVAGFGWAFWLAVAAAAMCIAARIYHRKLHLSPKQTAI
jgi:hypothetical protein